MSNKNTVYFIGTVVEDMNVAANYQGSDLLEKFTSEKNKYLVTTKGAEGVEIRGNEDKTDMGFAAAKINLEGKLNPVGVGNTYEAAVLQISMMKNPNENDMGKIMRFGVCAAAVKALKEGVPYLTEDDVARIQGKHKEYMQDERFDAYCKERSVRQK